MRKYNICVKTAIAVFAVVLSACSSDNDVVENDIVNPESPVSNNDIMTFSASMDAGNVTRTDFNSNSTIWAKGDKIRVLNLASVTGQDGYKNNGYFNIVKQSGTFTKEELFTGTRIKSNGDGTDEFYAYYPHDAKAAVETNQSTSVNYIVQKGNIPAVQEAKKDSFAQSLHYMTALSSTTTFAFKNVCALLKITLKDYANIKRVRVLATPVDDTKSTNTSYIAGDFDAKIVNSDGTTTIAFTGNNSPYVELKLPVSGDDCQEGTFYMVVLPASITNGFTLFFEKTDGTIYMRRNTHLQEFVRNKVYDLGDYDCYSSSETPITPENMSVLENYVDLGLPSGTLWCTKNVTAGSGTSTTLVNSIYDNGGYYAWGEIFAYNQTDDKGNKKTVYTGGTYTGLSSWYTTSTTTTTLPSTLKYQRDAAYKIESHLYCMPTYTQIQELFENCNVTYYISNAYSGHYGVMLTSKNNDNTLWLPAAGYHYDSGFNSGLNNENKMCHYWSRTLYTSNTDYAYCLDFTNGELYSHGGGSGASTWYDRRDCGKSIRPVLNIPAFK